ncbi:MAG: hypothetical protein KJO81_07380, partial [Gammaproteobacteria bacterium]|nr:hypothetical protein [Gammaproteobacteria bacterium]
MTEATQTKDKKAAPKKVDPNAGKNIKIVKDATCTFCGCVCDDMELTVDLDEHRITKAKRACVLGRAWFYEHTV